MVHDQVGLNPTPPKIDGTDGPLDGRKESKINKVSNGAWVKHQNKCKQNVKMIFFQFCFQFEISYSCRVSSQPSEDVFFSLSPGKKNQLLT